MGIFNDTYHQQTLARVGTEASQAKSQVQELEREVLYMSRRVERLSIACQALWEILRERATLSEDDIQGKMLEIDLRDGELDGKMTRHPVRCAACGRMSNSARTNCLFCGSELPKENLFE
ncbi:MAG: hypothetical protein SFU56_13925 [Capsulimonadales bacterium]|nr:hypothetical protein [Capsulimonadales bacterium]